MHGHIACACAQAHIATISSDIVDYRRKRESGKKEAGPCLEENICPNGYSCEKGSCFATNDDGGSQNGEKAASE
ncbi:hypothetical protein DdX_06694 [Ditylenchus destructor]|uniref:Uncharacterized protein n=1 Tax=Ditylenchus destructor TaxID=166010 RepID=A0AAD4N9J7_9BILA|nr:hypothetical protein DdX_06694 [Ditylenchus destructor]